jgi:hypothetical protein
LRWEIAAKRGMSLLWWRDETAIDTHVNERSSGFVFGIEPSRYSLRATVTPCWAIYPRLTRRARRGHRSSHVFDTECFKRDADARRLGNAALGEVAIAI